MLQSSPAHRAPACPRSRRPRWPSLALAALLALLLASGSAATRPAPSYAAVALKPGDFIVGGGGPYYVVDGASGALTYLRHDGRFDTPTLVATTLSGDIYVVENNFWVDEFRSQAIVARIDSTQDRIAAIYSFGNDTVSGIASDKIGLLYVVIESGRIVRLNPLNGQQSIVASGGRLVDPSGIAIETDGSLLTTALVNASSSVGPRHVIRIRAASSTHQVLSTGGLLLTPHAVAVGPDGSVFVSDHGGALSGTRVIRIDPASGTQEAITPTGGGTFGQIVADSPRAIYVTRQSSGPDAQGILRIDLTSRLQTWVVQSSDLRFPYGLAMVQTGSPLPCPTRSPVSVQAAPDGPGRLRVHVHAAGSPNRIREIRIGEARGNNAVVDGAPVVNGADATFFVRRTGPGAVTLPFVVSDACGDWPTFVGGGPNAF